ncbi:MAG: hypothetical protein NW201_01255 [Gemmatimonadales bacterium]|nr:hypothetical protein [Gemmatimonadales bacterium]
MLGGLSLQREGESEPCPVQPRRLALLALLDAAGEKGISRDALLGMLWPDVSEARARHALRQCLHGLRRDTSHDLVLGKHLLTLDRTQLTSDRAAFLIALASGQAACAAEFWEGRFLDGFHLDGAPAAFESWVDRQRQDLDRAAASLFGGLWEDAMRRGTPYAAMVHAEALRRLDPTEPAHVLRLVEASERAGEAASARRVIDGFEREWREAVGLPLPRSLQAARERLLRGDAPANVAVPAPPAADAPPETPPQRAPEAPHAAPEPATRPRRQPRSPVPARTGRQAWAAAVMAAALALLAVPLVRAKGKTPAPPRPAAAEQRALAEGVRLFRLSVVENRLMEARDSFLAVLARDSTSVAAWSRLAQVEARIYWHGYDRTPARLAAADSAARRAVALGPRQADAYSARAMVHYVRREWAEAMTDYQLARERAPGDLELLQQVGKVERRLGRWPEALAHFEEAARLDSVSANDALLEVAWTAIMMHDGGTAARAAARLQALTPTKPAGWVLGAMAALSAGDSADASRLLSAGNARAGARQTGTLAVRWFPTLRRTLGPALFHGLDAATAADFGGREDEWQLALAEHHAADAPPAVTRARFAAAEAAYAARTADAPGFAEALADRARAQVGLGRLASAERLARQAWRAVDDEDHFVSARVGEALALVLVARGQPEGAEMLAAIQQRPSFVSEAIARLDPVWRSPVALRP